MIEDGSLEEQLPEVDALVKSGASLRIIENFAFHLILEAYDGLLYQLDDHEGAEFKCIFGRRFFKMRLCAAYGDG